MKHQHNCTQNSLSPSSHPLYSNVFYCNKCYKTHYGRGLDTFPKNEVIIEEIRKTTQQQ